MLHLAHQQLYFPRILLRKRSTEGVGRRKPEPLAHPVLTFLVLDAAGVRVRACARAHSGRLRLCLLPQRPGNKCQTNIY